MHRKTLALIASALAISGIFYIAQTPRPKSSSPPPVELKPPMAGTEPDLEVGREAPRTPTKDIWAEPPNPGEEHNPTLSPIPFPGAQPEEVRHRKAHRNRPISPDQNEELLAECFSKLKSGNLAYTTPDRMKIGETAHVIAKIAGQAMSVSALKDSFPRSADRSVEISSTVVSPRMKMTLKSADFEITPVDSEEQIVDRTEPTTWRWDIVAKHPGKLYLHLTGIVEIGGFSKDFASIDREIAVEVSQSDELSSFLKENWKWIVATLTTLGGFIWKLCTRKKGTDASKNDPELKIGSE